MRKLFKGQKQAVDEIMRRAAEGTESEWIAEKGGFEEVLHKSLILAVKEAEALQGKTCQSGSGETIIARIFPPSIKYRATELFVQQERQASRWRQFCYRTGCSQ
jgi:hypothetical protein